MSSTTNNVVVGAIEGRSDTSQGTTVNNSVSWACDKAGEAVRKIIFDSDGTGPDSAHVTKVYQVSGANLASAYTLYTLPTPAADTAFVVEVVGVASSVGNDADDPLAFAGKFAALYDADASAWVTQPLYVDLGTPVPANWTTDTLSNGAGTALGVLSQNNGAIILTAGSGENVSSNLVYEVKVISSVFPAVA